MWNKIVILNLYDKIFYVNGIKLWLNIITYVASYNLSVSLQHDRNHLPGYNQVEHRLRTWRYPVPVY